MNLKNTAAIDAAKVIFFFGRVPDCEHAEDLDEGLAFNLGQEQVQVGGTRRWTGRRQTRYRRRPARGRPGSRGSWTTSWPWQRRAATPAWITRPLKATWRVNSGQWDAVERYVIQISFFLLIRLISRNETTVIATFIDPITIST